MVLQNLNYLANDFHQERDLQLKHKQELLQKERLHEDTYVQVAEATLRASVEAEQRAIIDARRRKKMLQRDQVKQIEERMMQELAETKVDQFCAGLPHPAFF